MICNTAPCYTIRIAVSDRILIDVAYSCIMRGGEGNALHTLVSDPQGRTMVSSWVLCCLDALFEVSGGVQVTEVTAQPNLELAPAGAIRLHYLTSPNPQSYDAGVERRCYQINASIAVARVCTKKVTYLTVSLSLFAYVLACPLPR